MFTKQLPASSYSRASLSPSSTSRVNTAAPRPKGESLATSTASSRSWTGGAYSTRAGVRDRGREWRVAPAHGRPEAGVDLACLESVGGTTTGETIDAHHFA